jgi:hypothetical protein
MVPGENKLGPFIFALYCYVYGWLIWTWFKGECCFANWILIKILFMFSIKILIL